MCISLHYTEETDQLNDSLDMSVALHQLYGKDRGRSSDVNVHTVAFELMKNKFYPKISCKVYCLCFHTKDIFNTI